MYSRKNVKPFWVFIWDVTPHYFLKSDNFLFQFYVVVVIEIHIWRENDNNYLDDKGIKMNNNNLITTYITD